MSVLPTLDAHAHLDPAKNSSEFAGLEAVLAMTFSLQQAAIAVERKDDFIAWGVGCHPRVSHAQDEFDEKKFHELIKRTALIGEVGLDGTSRVELSRQLRVWRSILETISQTPRLVNIHSYQATSAVLKELKRITISFPVLHRWTGSVRDTQEAVELGCYFSIHPQVARHRKFREHVPLERVLLETDYGINEPPAGILTRIRKTEQLVAESYGRSVSDLRRIVWNNLRRIFGELECRDFLPKGIQSLIGNLADAESVHNKYL